MPMLRIRKYLPIAIPLAVAAITAVPEGAAAQVSGRILVTDAGGRTASDMAGAVVYLEAAGRGPRMPERRFDMALDGRQFHPRVLVVPVGATVRFPNLDPFNHNVFSAGEMAFDLGLYGHNGSKTRRFTRPGLVRVYCNIHPRMVGFILVRDNPWYTQPGADGSFTIPDVPPGAYTLEVWHERTAPLTRDITVPEGGLTLDSTLALDASGYQYVQHKNKYGQDYGSGAARERY